MKRRIFRCSRVYFLHIEELSVEQNKSHIRLFENRIQDSEMKYTLNLRDIESQNDFSTVLFDE